METLRNYLESMFKRYPDTPEAEKAKAELWQMMEDKYNELMSEGKKENEAVGIVISEFGDLEEVADSLGISTMLQKIEQSAGANKEAENKDAEPKATVTAERIPASECTVETAKSPVIINEPVKDYSFHSSRFTENTEQKDEYSEFAFHLLHGFLSVFWPTITCLYLCWSFLTFKWWMTWIIWPLAAILHSVLKRLFVGDISAEDGRVYKSRLIAAVLDSYWPCVVFVYFAISFLTGAWHITWLIYVIAPFIRNYLRRVSTEEGEL